MAVFEWIMNQIDFSKIKFNRIDFIKIKFIKINLYLNILYNNELNNKLHCKNHPESILKTKTINYNFK